MGSCMLLATASSAVAHLATVAPTRVRNPQISGIRPPVSFLHRSLTNGDDRPSYTLENAKRYCVPNNMTVGAGVTKITQERREKYAQG